MATGIPDLLNASADTLRLYKAKLQKARLSAARRVQFGDDLVEFRSDAEIAAALDYVDRQIAGQEGRSAVQIVNIRTKRDW